MPPAAKRSYRVADLVDARAALLFGRRGPRDPTVHVDGATVWRATRTPEGPATVAARCVSGAVDAVAWGPGAEWALDQLPRRWGADDDLTGFDATKHPVVETATRRFPGLRLGATDLVMDALVEAIFEQKVTGLQAFGGWGHIVRRHGERAPGPLALWVPPERWDLIPSWVWQGAGVEPSQSRTIVRAAQRRATLERVLTKDTPLTDRERVLSALPGVGAWTSAETRARAFGDPDAVSVGDYHLAHEVGYALTGERVDDDAMLELLEPWRGHRQRVIRLLRAAGPREPRRGARVAPEDHRAH